MVALCCRTSVASAQDISYAGAIPIGLAAVGAITVSIVNTVQIAQGDGSKFWGWTGIIVGSGIVAAFATYNDSGDTWGYFAGGAVAGLGLWSVLLTRSDQNEKATNTGVRLAPALMLTRDDRVQPGMVVTVGF
jgi:hypothetical protein